MYTHKCARLRAVAPPPYAPRYRRRRPSMPYACRGGERRGARFMLNSGSNAVPVVSGSGDLESESEAMVDGDRDGDSRE